MGLPVVNYKRLQRIEAAENPTPGKWDMSNATKFCCVVVLIGLMILFKRWKDKKDRTFMTGLGVTNSRTSL